MKDYISGFCWSSEHNSSTMTRQHIHNYNDSKSDHACKMLCPAI